MHEQSAGHCYADGKYGMMKIKASTGSAARFTGAEDLTKVLIVGASHLYSL